MNSYEILRIMLGSLLRQQRPEDCPFLIFFYLYHSFGICDLEENRPCCKCSLMQLAARSVGIIYIYIYTQYQSISHNDAYIDRYIPCIYIYIAHIHTYIYIYIFIYHYHCIYLYVVYAFERQHSTYLNSLEDISSEAPLFH